MSTSLYVDPSTYAFRLSVKWPCPKICDIKHRNRTRIRCRGPQGAWIDRLRPQTMSKNKKAGKKRPQPSQKQEQPGRQEERPPDRLNTVQQMPPGRGPALHQVDAEDGRQGALDHGHTDGQARLARLGHTGCHRQVTGGGGAVANYFFRLMRLNRMMR